MLNNNFYLFQIILTYCTDYSGLLSRAGYKVLVLEQHDVAGGGTHTFVDRGFEFDTGLHYVGGALWKKNSAGRQLWDLLTDGKVEWKSMGDIFDVACTTDPSDGNRMEVPSGRERFRNKLKERFSHSKTAMNAIDSYFDEIARICGASVGYFTWKVLMSFSVRWSFVGFIISKIASFPWMRDLLCQSFLTMSDPTVAEKLEILLQDVDEEDKKLLKHLLVYHWGNYGLPPSSSSWSIHAMVWNHYWDGACYPVGGASALARHCIPGIERGGGKVFVRAPVKRIIIENGHAVGVEMKRGIQIRAPIIVSTAGARVTFEKLVGDSVPAVAPAISSLRKMVGPSVGHLSLFVALDGDHDTLRLPGYNIWIRPSENHGGADVDTNTKLWHASDFGRIPQNEKSGVDYTNIIKSSLTNDCDVDGMAIGLTSGYFISFPCVKDATWKERHPGKSTCHILAECPYEWFKQWEDCRVKHRGSDYETAKAQLTKKLLYTLHQALPTLPKSKIVFADLGTPVTSNFYYGVTKGESYGLEHTPTRFREGMDWLRFQSPIPGLFLGGVDALTAGVQGANTAGVLCAVSISPLVAIQNLQIILNL